MIGPQTSLDLVVEASNMTTAFVPIDLGNESKKALKIVLKPAYFLAGVIVNGEGLPIAGSDVDWSDNHSCVAYSFDPTKLNIKEMGGIRGGRQCKNGSFRVWVSRDTHLNITAPGYERLTIHEVPWSCENVVIALRRKSVLHGQVIDAETGAPIQWFFINSLVMNKQFFFNEIPDPQ